MYSAKRSSTSWFRTAARALRPCLAGWLVVLIATSSTLAENGERMRDDRAARDRASGDRAGRQGAEQLGAGSAAEGVPPGEISTVLSRLAEREVVIGNTGSTAGRSEDRVADEPFLEILLRSLAKGGVTLEDPPSAPEPEPYKTSPGRPHEVTRLTLRSLSGRPPAIATLEFGLPRTDEATLAIYDARGRLVAMLHSGHMGPGVHRVTWDGRDKRGRLAGPGVYFARLLTRASGVAAVKLVVAR